MRGLIYGKTLKSAQLKLQHIINDYEFYKIATAEKIRPNEVIFSNGDYWCAFGYSESNIRGRKCNIVYIDAAITDTDALCDIECTVTAPPFQAIHYYTNIMDRND